LINDFFFSERYKPSLFANNSSPGIVQASCKDHGYSSNDFGISPFISLPDSFGDIYIGETFTVYVAVLNALQDSSLHNASLSLRLQTANSTHDLLDIRPQPDVLSGECRILPPNEAVDVIASHVLSEVGTYTLRATVQFMVGKLGEVVTVRKFYRFNVSQPLSIVSTCKEVEGNIVVQCQVSNTSKFPLFIENVSIVIVLNDLLSFLG